MINWLTIAILAQIIIGSSAVFDKLLLKKRSIEPWPYTFWFGALGLSAALLLPFGYQAAPIPLILLAFGGGAFFIASAFFYFRTLEKIEASEALPLMGALSPIATLILSASYLGTALGILDLAGFGLLISSGFLLFFAERKELKIQHIAFIGIAALFLAASHVISKAVFNQTSFITGFFWMKIGGAISVFALLAFPGLRRKVSSSEHTTARNKLWYFANRGYAAAGSLLVSLAIALSAPPLVDASQNIRYLIIFMLGWLVLREQFRGRVLFGKIAAALLIAFGLGSLALAEYARSLPPVDGARSIVWGITFSDKFSRELGLDWRENFRVVLEELKPKLVRLIAYWDEVEPRDGEFNFDDLDWQISEAARRGVPVILAMGLKLPRWPECHMPEWTKELPLSEREKRINDYLTEVVRRYHDYSAVMMWQVENEPFLLFGECPRRDPGLVEREISLVRSLDPARPILTTDGGEFGLWNHAARLGDVFGTTMYRKAYPRFIGPIFGIIEYPISPSYFRIKEKFVKWVNKTPTRHFIVSELQGEPWEPQSLKAVPYEKMISDFSPEYFRDTIEYAKAADFDEYYLWGAEWWYWIGATHNDWRYWNIMKELILDMKNK